MDGDNVSTRKTPAMSTKVIGSYPDSPAFDQHFHYRSVIGKLNYLEKSTRGDIAYAVHQCARFAASPKKEHGEAVKLIGRYLAGTRDKGLYIHPRDEGLQVWADADFSGNWRKEEAMEDSDTARSRSGYAIFFMGCPLMWKSQLQTEIALSSTESEYICLSQALRKAIPIMEVIKEMKDLGYDIGSSQPNVRCTLFEDNSGALTMAKAPAMRPRMKHINTKYHFFRSFVANRDIVLEAVASAEQTADCLTKALDEVTFCKHRKSLLGW